MKEPVYFDLGIEVKKSLLLCYTIECIEKTGYYIAVVLDLGGCQTQCKELKISETNSFSILQ